LEILRSFSLKDEATLKARRTKAEEFLDMTKSNSENNLEIISTTSPFKQGLSCFLRTKTGYDFV
jgi:hypothetical protein